MKPRSLPVIYEKSAELLHHRNDIYTFQFLSPKESFGLLEYCLDKEPLELAKHKKTKYIAERDNYRSLFIDYELARYLYETDDFQRILEHFPGARCLNPNFRLYKYKAGQVFGPHYDEEAVADGHRGRYTILLYLSGLNAIPNPKYGTVDKLEGGATVFSTPMGHLKIDPAVGMVLFHAQGQNCLLHEGERVKSGTKWVLRTDLMC